MREYFIDLLTCGDALGYLLRVTITYVTTYERPTKSVIIGARAKNYYQKAQIFKNSERVVLRVCQQQTERI